MTESVTWNGYTLCLPVWTIINREKLQTDGLFGSLIVFDHPRVKVPMSALGIFSEEVFGERMAGEVSDKNPLLVKLATLHELEWLVGNFLYLGGTYVVIDPSARDYSYPAGFADELLSGLRAAARRADGLE